MGYLSSKSSSVSRGVNYVFLLGRIGRDADTKLTSGGVTVSNFTLATNCGMKSGGDWNAETFWHNVAAWRLENLTPYLTKGRTVLIEAGLPTRPWEGDNGQRQSQVEIIAGNIVLA